MREPPRRTHALLAVAGVLLAGLAGPAGTPAADHPRIAVLMSHSAPPYDEALAGFRQHLRQQRLDVTIDLYRLEGDEARATPALQEARKNRARVVLALGSLATRSAVRAGTGIPVVAALVLSAADLEGTANATGVTLEFPLETQFEWLQRFVPAARRIGVVYSAAENQARVAAAAQVAERMGLRLEAQAIRSPRDIPSALATLENHADVLWGVVDGLVLTPQTAQEVLLFSFRNRIPFVGLSAQWVKAGALYALEWDYADLGAQGGEMAARILQGTAAGSIPPATPRKVAYSYNERTALHMKLDIPAGLARGAREVFR